MPEDEIAKAFRKMYRECETFDMALGDIRFYREKGVVPEHAYVCLGADHIVRINKQGPHDDVVQACKDVLKEKDYEEGA